MFKYLVLPPLVLAAGCASVNGISSSYVGQGIKPSAVKFIANDFYQEIKNRLPAATTTLIIKKNNPADNFTPVFVDLLRRKGYHVISTDQPKQQQNMGVTLTYMLTPKENGRIVSIFQYVWNGELCDHIRMYDNK
ncbi:hypothetical protein [Bartonella harrusi]|uniref:Conjugal transfer protein TrbH n=1 Tax=Bartonella harrusi TaxID=2961895 RepID=A0ABY5ETR7_9HYPH|nr:hypothetical protein [Bartonella harrusi]UTO28236.1 hypothetical protein NMK50_08825 [Bartonella harrusi]